MCTLTLVGSIRGIVITANRDENSARSADGLTLHNTLTGIKYLIAKEPVHGGTNLAIGYHNRVATLLNGGFTSHSFGRTYRLSRGIVVLKSLEFPDVFQFADHFDFQDIEPFTLVDFQEVVREIIWDGAKLCRSVKPISFHHLWASAQLYSNDIRFKRKQWFDDLLTTYPKPSDRDLFQFHREGGDVGQENNMVMNRMGMVQTVSITQIIHQSHFRKVRHFNLLSDSETAFDLEIR